MTIAVSASVSRKTFVGDGATTSFATTPLVFFNSDELTVYVVTTATGAVVATLTENTHYTVTGGAGSTGTVNLAAGTSPYGAPAATTTLVIVRDSDIDQETDHVNNDGSDAEVAEDALDKLTLIAAELDTRVDRSVRLPETDVSGASMEVPALSSRASKVLGFDANGAITVYGSSSSVTTSDNVTFTQSGTATSRTMQAKGREIERSITDHGATSGGDATDAVLEALEAFRDTGTSASITDPTYGAITMYQGGVLVFPPGDWYIDPDAIDISDIFGLTFRGHGSRFGSNYAIPRSRIRISGTSSGYGIRVKSNAARNFKFDNIAVEYDTANFTGHLVDVSGAVGFSAERTNFGDTSTTNASAIRTAASLLRLSLVEAVSLQRVSFTNAVRGLWIPTASQMCNGLSLDTVFFYDLSTSQMEYEAAGSLGLSMRNVFFDPINISPTDGAIIYCNGFDIGGCLFVGASDARTPSGWFAKVIGRGKFDGNYVSGTGNGVQFNGEISYNANRIRSEVPVQIVAGRVTGKSNDIVIVEAGTKGIDIACTSTTTVDLGPDVFTDSGTGSTNSYVVATDNSAYSGVIRYALDADGTDNKFVPVSEHIRIEPLEREEVAKTADYTLSHYESGKTFTNVGAVGAVIFTLPSTAVVGSEFTLAKFSNQDVTLTAQGSHRIYDGTPTGQVSVTNARNEIGASITVRCMTTTGVWRVTERRGTWGQTETLRTMNTTAVGNVGTGEDNLQTGTIAANTLKTTTYGVRITAWGTYANNANAKTLKLYFGATAISTQTLTASQAGTWEFNAVVYPTGTDSQDYKVRYFEDGTAQVHDLVVGTLTEDDGAAITVKCTGEATSNSDVVQEGLLVEYV